MNEDDLPDFSDLDAIDGEDFADDDGEVEWWEFTGAQECAEAVAGDAAFIIDSALDARGKAVLALPVSPATMPMLAALAEQDIQWRHVTIIPTHDWLVAVDNPRSHVRALAGLFLAKGARVLPMAPENADYRSAGAAANARLADVHWPLDLVWLEMDDHGNCAGIAAGPDMTAAMSGDAALRAIGVHNDGADLPQVTLTKAAISAAKTLIVTLDSAARQTQLMAMLDGEDRTTPIGAILADAAMSVDIYVQK
jgi:6-phosphogluconolactonase